MKTSKNNTLIHEETLHEIEKTLWRIRNYREIFGDESPRHGEYCKHISQLFDTLPHAYQVRAEEMFD